MCFAAAPYVAAYKRRARAMRLHSTGDRSRIGTSNINTCGARESLAPNRHTDMSDETETVKGKREISSIGFPYLDITDAIAVARTMLDRGGVAMDRDQLAAALGQVPTSGAFNIKLSTARMFGVIDNAQGKYMLSPLGFEILDPNRSQAAMAEAFLKVPLYQRVFEEFKGRQLPPRPHGLEQAFVNFGVSPKQKDRARIAFDRSARAAGFFPSPAEDRLVQPVIAPFSGPTDSSFTVPFSSETPTSATTPSEPSRRGGLHPFVDGLLETLPPVKSDWSSADRAKWLQAAAQIFDLLYAGGDAPIVVEVRK